MSANPFRNCLDALDEAEDAYFRREGLDAFAEWAKAHAGLLRGAMAMLADEVDEARRTAQTGLTDKATPSRRNVYN